jgi:hypothetical protein
MKKRHLTLLLLIWLFSQHLFAAVLFADVLVVSSTSMNCLAHAQSDCSMNIKGNTTGTSTNNATQHMGHIMHMVSDSAGSLHDQLLMSCDHCATVCQPSIISNNLLVLVDPGYLLFDAQPIDTTVDTFLNTLYRPPILS